MAKKKSLFKKALANAGKIGKKPQKEMPFPFRR